MSYNQVGFIGLGVMGEPMCRNLAVKSGVRVLGYDRDPRPLDRLAAFGVERTRSVREAVLGSNVVFLCLPSGEAVDELARVDDGLLALASKGQIIVDYDDAGAIGRRYRRHDEIGTPFCVTFDFDSLDDNAVTVRDRDTMAQERVSLDKVEGYLSERLGC